MDSVTTTASESEGSGQMGYRWVMLAGLWLAYGSFGLVNGTIPPLIGPVSESLNLSRSAMGSVLGAWPLVYIAISVPAGALIDRFGLRRAIGVGIILIALSGVLRAVAVNYATLFLAVAIFGLGGPFVSIGAPKLISTWFSRRERGTAMGIYLTSIPVGQTAALATANSILMPLYGASWRLTLATYGGVVFLAGITWWFLARDLRPESDGAPASSTTLASSLKVFPILLRSRVVQIVLVMSIGTFLFGHGISDWLPEILRAGGMTATKAGLWATLPVVIGVVATLIVPRLATPRRRIPMLVVVFLAAGASAVIVGTTTGVLLTLGLILLGIAGRSAMPIVLLTLMDAPHIGAERMGSAGGLYFTAGEVGGVLGPLLVGVIADATGGFVGAVLMLAGLTAVLATLAIRLGFVLRRQT